MASSGQSTLASSTPGELTGADSPTIGETIDYTHRAHTRYAANGEKSVIWYDPRDGREDYSIRSVEIGDFEDADDRILSRIKVRPFRPDEAVDGRYVVQRHYARVETLRRSLGGTMTETVSRVSSCTDAECFEDVEAAREWCRENVDGYADAPRRDAVRARGDA